MFHKAAVRTFQTPAKPTRAHPLIYLLGTLLIVVTLGAFFIEGVWGWAAGLLYILYDTWVLLYVLWNGTGPEEEPAATPALPRTAVIVAARNEGAALLPTLAALAAQDDPAEEVWVVDDGSSDGMADRVADAYALVFSGGVGTSPAWPALRFLKKSHTGKSDSLNRAWPRAEAEVLITLDADTVLSPGAVGAVRRAFGAEPALAAACGVLTPRCSRAAAATLFELYQTFEYLRAFLARRAWMRSGALLLVSGAFAAYRKSVLAELGGFDPESLVEDYDLIHRLHRRSSEAGRGWTVRVLGSARATTDAPATARTFLKQRQRWFSGFLQTQFQNADMVGNAAFGPVGTLMLPVKAADTLQPLYGLAAFLTLLMFLVSGRGIHPLILAVIAAKLALDMACHFVSVGAYYRWLGERPSAATWTLSAAATLSEPLGFQLLRHAGALIGWVGFLKGVNDWSPQRGAAGGPA